ncbi:MAG: hypothetical protein K6E18_07755 [Lachnospiraceae bacterium]|nr:hypothetical protein [Lachnospiraceae bacterium]
MISGGVGVSQSNKDYTHDNHEAGYSVRADTSGVWIHDKLTGYDTQKTLWSSFSDNGSYPFSDWGRAGDTGDSITLSSQGKYNYTQALQNGYVVSLDFTVMDEVSQQAVIDTFNGITIGTYNNNTEVSAVATSAHPEASTGRGTLDATLTQRMKNTQYTSTVNNSYHLQSVDNGDGTTTDKNVGTVSIKLGDTIFSGNYSVNSDKEKTDVVLYQNGNTSSENKITVRDFYYQVKGQVGTFETNVSGDITGVISRRDYSASVNIDFLYQRDHGRDFNRTTDIFNTNSTPISISQNTDGSGTVSLMVGDTVFSGTYASANSDDRVNITLYQDGVNSSNKIRLTDFDVSNPYQYLSINGKNVSQTLTTHMPTYGDVATSFGVVMRPVEKHLILQASGRVDDEIEIRWNSLTSSSIGIGGASALSQDAAMSTIDQVRYAQRFISGERIKFGAAQNRVEHAMSQNRNTAENTAAAESAIRDTDMAKEMVQNAKDNILQQAGQTMLAQANQNRQGLLQLLG